MTNRVEALKRENAELRASERYLSLTNREADGAVNEVLRATVCALESGIRVELRGFGSFSVKWHDARMGRNPRTGEKVQVPGKFVPYFKAGKEIRDALNRKAGFPARRS